MRLIYPAADADVPVRALTPTQEELDAHELSPPNTKDAYWLTNYGKPGAGSTDTTYIVSHRWIEGDAPFNRIGDRARAGDRLRIQTTRGDLDFEVTSVKTYNKDALAGSPVWDIHPGWLVLITCDLKDPWGKNTVVTARPR
ncbi:class F sortase [Arthrobacter woluwensis]|uniref:class F sortase n=1 Tax=Arthrobacter woluwensis TaxID=156980 RepID=UPI0011A8C2F6|nr:class F sortase [Arthrobacter woluwensis]